MKMDRCRDALASADRALETGDLEAVEEAHKPIEHSRRSPMPSTAP